MIHDAFPRPRPSRHTKWSMRASWFLLCAATVALFAIGQWFLYFELQQPCNPPACTDDFFYLSTSDIVALQARGFAPSMYAGYQVGLYVVFFLVHAAIATLIFVRRSDDRMARYAAFALLFWSATFPSTPTALWTIAPFIAWLMGIGATLGGLFFYLFLYTFPDGRFAPRWILWLILPTVTVLSGLSLLNTFGPDSTLARQLEPFRLLSFALALFGSVGSQIYRYVRVSSVTQREQTKWVFFGIVTGLGWIALLVATTSIFGNMLTGAFGKMTLTTLIYLGFLLIPLSIAVAILRARLWDIDLIINRALVYGALTACVVALYVLVVGYLSTVFQTSGSLLISLLATGLVAVLFQPLREALQRAINRLLYGERDTPYAALARLGQRLEGTLAPDAVLPTIVQSVREALKLPYVAIILDEEDRSLTAASAGTPAPDMARFPLTYQGETLGQLVLAPRSPSESFSMADRRLLDDLARQAGVAAHAVRLTADLQRARERLVAAREEERRRIRRDLHDGLGPQLASQTLMIDAILRYLPNDLPAAQELLLQLKNQSQGAIADIRRLVYALRPPALDDLGLVGALEQQIAQYGQSTVHIVLRAPNPLPALPAAVEVAVYRIVQEALTNVVKHSGARRCVVEIAIDGVVDVTIADDGHGVAEGRRAGVGLTSMRERAAELGGTLLVEPGAEGGTRVEAHLPLATRED